MTLLQLAKFDEALGIRRTAVLFLTLYWTLDAYRWASDFAMASARPGLEIAAIIGAVLAPISYLQKAVFDAYILARKQ